MKLQRKKWKDPEFRQKQITAVKKGQVHGDAYKKQCKALKEKWKDPEFREKQSERNKKISEALKKKWEEVPDFRGRQTEVLRETLKNIMESYVRTGIGDSRNNDSSYSKTRTL